MTDIVTLSTVSMAFVPVVMAITQVFKTFIVDGRWAPLVSIASGIVLSFAIPEANIVLTVLQGVLIGLTASGLFSGGKAMAA